MPNNGPNAEWSSSGMHRGLPSENAKQEATTDATPLSAKNHTNYSTIDNPTELGSTIESHSSVAATPSEAHWQISVSSNNSAQVPVVDTSVSDSSMVDRQSSSLPEVDLTTTNVVVIQGTATSDAAIPADGEQKAGISHVTGEKLGSTANLGSPAPRSEQPDRGGPHTDQYESPNTSAFADIPDDVVIGQLPERHFNVVPGNELQFTVNLLNNGTQISVFSPELIGAVPKQWCSIAPSHTRLHPGEQTSFQISIQPPRQATIRIGSYPLAVRIRSGIPQRVCQLGFTLQIEPFSEIRMGALRPRKVILSWRRPASTVLLPITNDSNVSTELKLHCQDSQQICSYTFSFSEYAYNSPNLNFDPLINAVEQNGHYSPQYGPPAASSSFMDGPNTSHQAPNGGTFRLLPGQTHYAPITVRYRNPHLFALKRQMIPFGIAAYSRNIESQPVLTQSEANASAPIFGSWTSSASIKGKIVLTPLFGPGMLFGVLGAGILGVLAITVTLLLLMLSLYPKVQTAQQPLQVVAANPTKAALEIIVKVNEVVPSSGLNQQPALAQSANDRDTPSDAAANAQGLEGIQEMSFASVADAVPTAIVVQVPSDSQSTTEEQQNSQPGVAVVQPNAVDPSAATTNGERVSPQPFTPASPDAVTAEGVPIVQPSMITSPDDTSTIAQAAVTNDNGPTSHKQGGNGAQAEQPNASQAGQSINAGDSMTYEQMFRTIGSNYDLDWRRLAAQAYVESSFNPLALGKKGDLGLMQILPTTWQEWAPRVDAKDPFDSYSNVLVAAMYTDYLRSLLGAEGITEEEWVLVAYNWGPNRVIDFIEAGGNWEALSTQRRKYAQDIIRIANSLPEN